MLVEKMGLQLIFIAFFLSGGLDFGRAEIGNDSKEMAQLNCKCRGSNINKTFNLKRAEKMYNVLLPLYTFGMDNQHEPQLKRFKKCDKCELVIFACNKEDPSNSFCLKRTAHFAVETWRKNLNGTDMLIISWLQQDSVVTNAQTQQEGSGRGRRAVRKYDVCMVPKNLQTASLSCTVTADHKLVKCTQNCAFGYTLKDGIQRKHECNIEEDKWTPTGFEECTQFVGCKIELVNRGYANCSSTTETEGPECLISCLPFEDIDATSKESYRCQIDGTWDPPLPFCAQPERGMKLAKAPAIKLHVDLLDHTLGSE